MKVSIRAALAAAVLWLLVMNGAVAAAPAYPVKPVRMIVGFPPGGPTDLVARLVSPKLAEALGQPFVIDNRPGAGGTLGAAILSKSLADGYTLLTAANGEIAIAPSLYPKLPYDPLRDFAPVSRIGSSPLLLVVYPGVAATSVQELIALAKSRPGKINFASGGAGVTPHLAFELFKMMTATDMVHVPYKGAGPAITGLMGGQVDALFTGVSSIMPQVSAGKLRALATSSAKRLAILPQIPAIAETVPGYDVSSWFGIFAPANTPKEVIARLHGAISALARDEAMKGQFASLGIDPEGNDPVRFAAQVREDTLKWTKVVKAAGVKVD